MERPHYKHSRLIKDMFVEDKAEFLKLPKTPFEVFVHEFAKADNYGKVKFDGRIYSASPELSGKTLIVKVGAHDVDILDQECNHIISHKRLYGDEKESMDWIPYLEVLAKRPTIIKYTGLFNQLLLILKNHLDKCSYENKKGLLKLFAKMTTLSGMEQAITSMEESIKLGVTDIDSVWVTYCRLNSRSYETEINLPPSFQELKEYLSNISSYDVLISRGGRN